MFSISMNCSVILEFVIVKIKKKERKSEFCYSWTEQLGGQTPHFYDKLIYSFNFGKH